MVPGMKHKAGAGAWFARRYGPVTERLTGFGCRSASFRALASALSHVRADTHCRFLSEPRAVPECSFRYWSRSNRRDDPGGHGRTDSAPSSEVVIIGLAIPSGGRPVALVNSLQFTAALLRLHEEFIEGPAAGLPSGAPILGYERSEVAITGYRRFGFFGSLFA